MSVEQIQEQLDALKMKGMSDVFRRYVSTVPRPDMEAEVLVAQMVEAEVMARHDQRMASRLRRATFKDLATPEQIDFKHARGLKKTEVLQLLGGGWLQHGNNLLITGATGLGTTFLACALGHRFCQDGHTVIFRRATRLFEDLNTARADGSYNHRIKALQTTDVLILDDFALEPLDASARHDLLEIMEDRYNTRSTIITSQFEPDHWHAAVGAPTHADSILDRLVHNALRLRLEGESMRKTRGQKALNTNQNGGK